jgi:hypothetical protein
LGKTFPQNRFRDNYNLVEFLELEHWSREDREEAATHRGHEPAKIVAQTSKSAVSQVSKPADRATL